MTKYTPGPWEVMGGRIVMESKNNRLIVATVPERDDDLFWETRNNARLIAAAPDLLKIAILSEETVGHHYDCYCGSCVWLDSERRAIIKKVKGE